MKRRFSSSSAANSTVAPARTRRRGSAGRHATTVPRMQHLIGQPVAHQLDDHVFGRVERRRGGDEQGAVRPVGLIGLHEVVATTEARLQNLHRG